MTPLDHLFARHRVRMSLRPGRPIGLKQIGLTLWSRSDKYKSRDAPPNLHGFRISERVADRRHAHHTPPVPTQIRNMYRNDEVKANNDEDRQQRGPIS